MTHCRHFGEKRGKKLSRAPVGFFSFIRVCALFECYIGQMQKHREDEADEVELKVEN